MKIKFNWGTGITILIIIGVLWYLFLVRISTKQEFHLVEDDYYHQGIEYDNKIDKVKNARALRKKPELIIKNDTIFLKVPGLVPGTSSDGDIWFYRPDNKHYDFHLKLDADSTGLQPIFIGDKRKGKYKLKLDWMVDSVAYYFEKTLVIN